MNRMDRIAAVSAATSAALASAANPDDLTPDEETALAEAITAATGTPAGGANTAAMWNAMSEDERAALLDSPAYRE